MNGGMSERERRRLLLLIVVHFTKERSQS